ncbi:MAG: hypothetical protein ACI82E_001124 [Nonlabens sp.]
MRKETNNDWRFDSSGEYAYDGKALLKGSIFEIAYCGYTLSSIRRIISEDFCYGVQFFKRLLFLACPLPAYNSGNGYSRFYSPFLDRAFPVELDIKDETYKPMPGIDASAKGFGIATSRCKSVFKKVFCAFPHEYF